MPPALSRPASESVCLIDAILITKKGPGITAFAWPKGGLGTGLKRPDFLVSYPVHFVNSGAECPVIRFIVSLRGLAIKLIKFYFINPY